MEYLDELMKMVAIPLLTAITAYVIALINAKRKQLIEATENDKYDVYINLLLDTVTKCVSATSQTYVETLKKENAFTKEAQVEAFNKTKTAVLDILSEDAVKYLTTAVGDLDSLLQALIEAEVKSQKR